MNVEEESRYISGSKSPEIKGFVLSKRHPSAFINGPSNIPDLLVGHNRMIDGILQIESR